ncbi:MAG: coproporphyrinogen III oxidase, partial [Ignavibacteriales bacterium CG12_big_fil_rev_8_21_14_0_65_30_8]
NEKKLYRNFQGYSTHAGTDLYSMGITAISQLNNIYTQNFKTEKEYYESLDKDTLPVAKGYHLTEDDQLRRDVIMKLMCNFELDMNAISEKYNISFKDYFQFGLNNLKEFQKDKLVKIENDKITVTEMGKLLIRNIAINFDGYIERKEDTAKYSKTI